MIPVNRLKRWPFPEAAGPDMLGAGEELRVEGEELLSVYGALTMALGKRDGARVFMFLKRLAAEAAERMEGGTPCIYFGDPMGEFGGVVEVGDEETLGNDEGSPDDWPEDQAGET